MIRYAPGVYAITNKNSASADAQTLTVDNQRMIIPDQSSLTFTSKLGFYIDLVNVNVNIWRLGGNTIVNGNLNKWTT